MLKFYSNWKMKTKIITVTSLLMLALSATLIVPGIIKDYRKTIQEIEDYQSVMIMEVENSLRDYVSIAYETIENSYRACNDFDYLSQRYGQELESIVNVAVETITGLQKKADSGEISISQAQKEAMDYISGMRYRSGSGYLWINDTGEPIPSMIMHPHLPSLNGTVLDDPKFYTAGLEKENIFVVFNRTCKESGQGFVLYEWPRPTSEGLTEYQPKLSFVTHIPGWNWIIGTGIYVEEAKVSSQRDAIMAIEAMRYDEDEGYFWINNTETPYPRLIAHPFSRELIGENLSDPVFNTAGENNENLFVAISEIIKESDEGYVDYSWMKPDESGNETLQQKSSYVRYFKPWDWVIGTGAYINEIQEDVLYKQQSLRDELTETIITDSLAALIGLLLAFTVLNFIIRSMTKPIGAVVDWTGKLAMGDLTQRLEVKDRSEIGIQNERLNEAAKAISELIGEMAAISRETFSMKDEMAANSEETAVALEQISRNLTSITGQVNTMTEEIGDSALAANTITGRITSLDTIVSRQSSAVEQSAAAVEEMLSSIGNVAETGENKKETIENLIETAEEMRTSISQTSATAITIGESIDEVLSVIDVIDDIASHSNLLAMNAAIEASHAGEAGKGFAVVAGEIRKLAENSAGHAKAISRILRNNVEDIEKMTAYSQETSDVLSGFSTEVGAVSGALTEIVGAMKELANGTIEIQKAIGELREISAEVDDSKEEMKESTIVVSRSFEEVNQLAHTVNGAITEVTNGASQINLAMNGLNTNISGIVRQIEKLGTSVGKFTV